MIWLPAGSGMPTSLAIIRSPPPGAQAPSHGARVEAAVADTVGQPGPTETGPALTVLFGILGLGRSHLIRADLEQDHMVHQSPVGRAARRHR